MLRERGIDREWIGRTLSAPDAREPDRRHPERLCALRRIPEFGDRWLRVVYVEDEEGGPCRVVTAFFDRNAGKGR